MAKVTYNYGSCPRQNYTYINFVQHLAPELPMNDSVFLHEESTEWRDNYDEIPFDLFKNVCHWKSARPFTLVQSNDSDHVNVQWNAALEALGKPPFANPEIATALQRLTELRGVAVPTASALLTAWNPNEFGIMDFKTLTVLGMPRRDSAAAYVAFRDRLLQLKNAYPALANCPLRKIELALWHYYPIDLSGPKERPE